MNGLTAFLAAIVVSLSVGWFVGGWHLRHQPTADELYGCTYTQADPKSGECK